MKNKNVLWFNEISFEDVKLVGGKGANLGEMYGIGIPVPNGFVVPSPVYFKFIEENKLRDKIKDILSFTNVDEPDQLLAASKKIERLVKDGKINPEIAIDIMSAYKKLSGFGGLKQVPVAVRTSATAEDSSDASFAGQGDTFLNVVGETNVLNRVKDCWASLFTPRSLFYQVKKHYDNSKIAVAVPVQKLVDSEVSGICFTVNPVTNEKSQIIVETIWGLGEYIVQGIVSPDQYIVNKNDWSLISENHVEQKTELIRSQHETKEITVPKSKQTKLKISDAMAIKIAKIGQKLQNHYGKPQDIEFAIDKSGKLFIVQTRPITTILTNQKIIDNQSKINQKPDLTGEQASPGTATGTVVIINSPKEIDRVQKGQVLVTTMTTPDFVPAMRKVNGIITDKGGQTSHAAIVSRELGVPCVVGTKIATKFFKEGDVVTLNGTTGEIWKGNLIDKNAPVIKKQASTAKTATKVYVNLGEPDLAETISKRNVDGIGLLRAEFMLANIGIHPKRVIAEGAQKDYINQLAKDLVKFCKSFSPRPVIYRATDFKTNEYRSLKWGKLYEPEEPNPLMGFRGAARYISCPDVFNMELEAIKKVRNEYGYKNLWLMIPFVHTPHELAEVKQIVTKAGLFRSPSFKFLMMAEIPSNVILLDKFIDVGIDGISIGSNDLTMLTLGLDRDNSEVAKEFNEMDPAVLWSLKRLVTKAKKRGIMCSICGQAPSNYPELVEKLVRWGATSISVSPDAIDATRDVVAWAEKRKVSE